MSELRGAGHEVLRLVRRAPSGADERQWNPPAGTIEDGALDGVDAVVNLCGAGIADRRWTEARKQIREFPDNARKQVDEFRTDARKQVEDIRGRINKAVRRDNGKSTGPSSKTSAKGTKTPATAKVS